MNNTEKKCISNNTPYLEYLFDNDCNDTSGNGFDGVLNGDVFFDVGEYGPYIRINGGEGYIDTSIGVKDLNDVYTVEFLINSDTSIEASACILNASLYKPMFFNCMPIPYLLLPDRWYHIAYVVDTPHKIYLYVNGIMVHVFEDFCSEVVLADKTLMIGRIGSDGTGFSGMVRRFRIWKKVLKEFRHAEITPSMQALALASVLKLSIIQIEEENNMDYAESLGRDEACISFEIAVPGEYAEKMDGLSKNSEQHGVNDRERLFEQISVLLEGEWHDFQCIEHERFNLQDIVLKWSEGYKTIYTPSFCVKPGVYWIHCRTLINFHTYTVTGWQSDFTFSLKPGFASKRTISRINSMKAGVIEQFSKNVSLDGDEWWIASDSQNIGKEDRWFEAIHKGAKKTRVPWVIQGIFPNYHGVAWYWHYLKLPKNLHPNGTYLLRFSAVDYYADIWLNGVCIGSHEGGETPFILDATHAAMPGVQNCLAVRVLNPTYDNIDGITLDETAHGMKKYPIEPNWGYNAGGIVDSVELIVAPSLTIRGLETVPDYLTGNVKLKVEIHNAKMKTVTASLHIVVAHSQTGRPEASESVLLDAPFGDSIMELSINIKNHCLWELENPCLYRVDTRIRDIETDSVDESSVRFGFRNFRFENGYFRFNGKRIMLHGSLYIINNYPVGYMVPHSLDMIRRDVMHMKTVGFNAVRISIGGGLSQLLDICDELGLLVYQEHYGAWLMKESTHLERRFDMSIVGIIRRDRNHPSVVSWGLLNETFDGRLFRHVVTLLPVIRSLDEGRLVVLSSGRFDNDWSIGSMSNPHSMTWDVFLKDHHTYPQVPHSSQTITQLRNLGRNSDANKPETNDATPVFLSEYGVCSAEDYLRYTRHFEQIGMETSADAQFYQKMLGLFKKDWDEWKLNCCFARYEDYFVESQKNQASLWMTNYNAIKANPNLIGDMSAVSIMDAWFHGCGVFNYFREAKPQMVDAACDLSSPIRICLFVEPANVFLGTRARFEAVLVNNDVLLSSVYPVRVQIIGPSSSFYYEKTVVVNVPVADDISAPPFAKPFFSEEILIDGQAGKYRFMASFQRGGAATGGDVCFYADNCAVMPDLQHEILLVGNDTKLVKWLENRKIPFDRFAIDSHGKSDGVKGKIVIISGIVQEIDRPHTYEALRQGIEEGCSAIFLDPDIFKDNGESSYLLPFIKEGRLGSVNYVGGYFHADSWAKKHPVFKGLPCGGVMDYTYYREIIPQDAFISIDTPWEAVCGALNGSSGYNSGLHVAVYKMGAGFYMLNNLKIHENLGTDPVSERLLVNMVVYVDSVI